MLVLTGQVLDCNQNGEPSDEYLPAYSRMDTGVGNVLSEIKDGNRLAGVLHQSDNYEMLNDSLYNVTGGRKM